MHRYIFFLGHQPTLSLAEIFSILRARSISYTILKETPKHLVLETEEPLPSTDLMKQLGGTISIAKNICPINQKTMADDIASYLHESVPDGKLPFSITGHIPKRLGIQIKKSLRALGRNARYVIAKNAASIIHNNLISSKTALHVMGHQLFLLEAVQPIATFHAKDYERPAFDSTSGMLPPKLARMMINLADNHHTATSILDPFCGSGTVLVEALTLDIETIYGTDHSKKAITDSETNLAWASKTFEKSPSIDIAKVDVREIDQHLPKRSVDLIVTEPYMGVPLHGNESRQQLESQAAELKSLLIDAFRAYLPILSDQARIIHIIPQFQHKGEWIMTQALPEICALGYDVLPLTPDDDGILYYRPAQHVGRMIYQFKKSA